MNWTSHFRRAAAFLLLGSTLLSAADKKDKPKSPSTQAVDSGSFAVFVKGQRVVTETFTVEQENGISVVKSRLQETNASSPGQTSEMQMTGGGELVRYQWNDASGSLTVTPNNEFLLEKITTAASPKPAEQPFLMPNTSAILDNNFFVQREVLAWRYLAGSCKNESGNLKCKPSDEFGVLIPQDRSSMRVRIEMVGKEKINLKGVDRDLLRLNLKSESYSWALWLDDKDQYKLMRVLIPDDNTEVIRE